MSDRTDRLIEVPRWQAIGERLAGRPKPDHTKVLKQPILGHAGLQLALDRVYWRADVLRGAWNRRSNVSIGEGLKDAALLAITVSVAAAEDITTGIQPTRSYPTQASIEAIVQPDDSYTTFEDIRAELAYDREAWHDENSWPQRVMGLAMFAVNSYRHDSSTN